MKTLRFWYHYITNPYFRDYVHLHDIQRFYDHIDQLREEKLRYQSNMMYSPTKTDKQ